MNLDVQYVITALQNQRNSALNECAQLYAMVEMLKREIAGMKKEKEEKPND